MLYAVIINISRQGLRPELCWEETGQVPEKNVKTYIGGVRDPWKYRESYKILHVFFVSNKGYKYQDCITNSNISLGILCWVCVELRKNGYRARNADTTSIRHNHMLLIDTYLVCSLGFCTI